MRSTAGVFVFIFSLNLHAYVPIDDNKLQELVESFNYVPNVNIIKRSKVSCEAQEMTYTVTYPQGQGLLTINAKTFIPEVGPAAVKVPMIIILPPMGGANTLDMATAKNFCDNRMAAIIITTNLTGLKSSIVPVTDHDDTHRRVAAAIKGLMIIGRTYAEIHPEKTGLFGASLGGILGSIAYSVIPEISAVTFLVNGGDVAHILATSRQKEIVNLKVARKKEQGLNNDADYEAYLNANLTLDPMHFAKLIDPETVRLYLSRNDDIVPSADQLLYYRALGSPKDIKFYDTGHVGTIVKVLSLSDEKQKIAEWFLKKFTKINPRLHPKQ